MLYVFSYLDHNLELFWTRFPFSFIKQMYVLSVVWDHLGMFGGSFGDVWGIIWGCFGDVLGMSWEGLGGLKPSLLSPLGGFIIFFIMPRILLPTT